MIEEIIWYSIMAVIIFLAWNFSPK